MTPETEDRPAEQEAPLPARKGIVLTAASTALLGAAVAGLAMAVLVLFTDPDAREEQLFISLLLIAATGLGWAAMLVFGRRTGAALNDTLRALRRGILFGLACSGAAILQVNAALNPPNLTFLLLVLLIVEMIFVARRQNPI